MRKIIKEYMLRGFIVAGFGPLTVAIVYAIIGAATKENTITTNQFLLAVVSSYILAFVIAGCSVVYQIEKLSLLKASLIHAVTLYASYLLCYLANAWIESSWVNISIFTGIFIVGYIIIWIIVYSIIKATVKKLNEKINKE